MTLDRSSLSDLREQGAGEPAPRLDAGLARRADRWLGALLKRGLLQLPSPRLARLQMACDFWAM